MVDNDRIGVGIPSALAILEFLWDGQFLDVIWALEDVDVQASAHVPGDVTMQWPDTGIILVPLENNVAGCTVGQTSLHQLDITTLGVVCMGDGSVPFTNTLGKDMVIVAVKMLED